MRSAMNAKFIARALILAFGATATLALLPGGAAAQEEDMVTVSGKLTYRERIALPPGAVVRATVQNMSRADTSSETLAEQNIQPESVPVPFRLEVPRDALQAGGRYGVRGTIREADGSLLWTTDTFVPVDPEEDEVDVGVLNMIRTASHAHVEPTVYRCDETPVLVTFESDRALLIMQGITHQLDRKRTASGAQFATDDGAVSFWTHGDTARLVKGDAEATCAGASQAAFLTGDDWVVEDINGGGVVDRSRSSLAFGADGRLSGRAGCNDYTGEWNARGKALETSHLAQTRKACVPALGRQEAAFIEVLSAAERFKFTPNGALVVSDGAGGTITARQQ